MQYCWIVRLTGGAVAVLSVVARHLDLPMAHNNQAHRPGRDTNQRHLQASKQHKLNHYRLKPVGFRKIVATD
jgi:hypothetical protein